MFSWSYLSSSILIIMRNPEILVATIQGKDVGVELHNRRIKKWSEIGKNYADKPKRIFDMQIFLIPEDYSTVSTSIGIDSILDLPLTCLLSKVLKKGMNIVDVGANLGYFTLLASRLVGENGTVFAFEPEGRNFQLLEKSVSVNNLHNVQLYQKALSDKQGKIELFLGDSSHPNDHSIGVDRGSGSVEIDSRTLDDFWIASGKPRIDLVKIHVVGEDPSVLKGAEKLISETGPMLAIV